MPTASRLDPGAHVHRRIVVRGWAGSHERHGYGAGTREQDKAIGAVADAEQAAARGDGPAALQYLKSAGKWTLKIAEGIGVPVAIEALKKAM